MPKTLALVPDFASEQAAGSRFVVAWTHEGVGAAWVRASGELDAAAAPMLASALSDAASEARLVVLDLRPLTCLGAAGVSVILEAGADARRNGRRLLLVRAPYRIQRAFGLPGNLDDLDVFELDPGMPAIQVLLELSRRESGAS